MTACQSMADYMEAVARKQKAEAPVAYGYKVDVAMGIGFFRDSTTGVQVLEKPVCVPSGKPNFQGYAILYAYSSEEGVKSLLEGALPPMLPATMKEPHNFASKEAIADNFGNKDVQASVKKGTSDFCVVIRVPSELAHKVDTPGRDIWIVRFDQDVIGPFLACVKEGDVAKVTKGVESGISGAVVDEEGVSALMIAAMTGSAETCDVLLKHGADVNGVEPQSSRTPLMFAAQGGATDVVVLLLGKKADPTKVDAEGTTALMWAAVGNRSSTAKVLAENGPKDTKNKEGLTALAIAEKMGHNDTIGVLKA